VSIGEGTSSLYGKRFALRTLQPGNFRKGDPDQTGGADQIIYLVRGFPPEVCIACFLWLKGVK